MIRQVHPRNPGGAAEGLALPKGPLDLTDLTAAPRFGLKGSGSTAWLVGHGEALPEVNRLAEWQGMRLLRLGREDLLLLAEDAGEALDRTLDSWRAYPGPRGWSAWREEGWAWFRLSGPALDEAMARLCAVDLRPTIFPGDRIAQTRICGVEAVVLRGGRGFDILFDIALTAHLIGRVTAATHDLWQREMKP